VSIASVCPVGLWGKRPTFRSTRQQPQEGAPLPAIVAAVAVGVGVAGVVALVIARWPWPERQLVAEGPANPAERADRPAEPPIDGAPPVAPPTLAPDAPSGPLLSVALVVILATACAIGVAAFLLRRDPTTFGMDQEIEAWAGRVSTAWSDEALRTLTHFGDTETVIVLATAAAAWYAWRRRSATAFAFLAVVIVGQWLAAETVRAIVERARPALSPRAGFSGASFPSGHSTAATACYLAIAFVMTAGLPRRERAALIGAGAGIGVAVASTRVLLGVHWFTDAVAGVALGASIALLAHAAFARRPRWWRARDDDGARASSAVPVDVRPRVPEGQR
jgi:membrane-associated phospholipid phosphatase